LRDKDVEQRGLVKICCVHKKYLFLLSNIWTKKPETQQAHKLLTRKLIFNLKKMFAFNRNRKLARDEFHARSKKRFNFLHILDKPNKKKDLNTENFIKSEKVPKM
jgi:hypothetical protein